MSILSFDPARPWRFIARVDERARRQGVVLFCITRSTQPPFITLCSSQRFGRVRALVLSVRADVVCRPCALQASQLDLPLLDLPLLAPQSQPKGVTT